MVVAAVAVGGDEFNLGFRADGEFFIDQGIGNAAVDLVGVFAVTARLELGDEVDAPVDSRGELVTEEELSLDRVRIVLVGDVFEVERGVEGNLAPIG